MSETPKPCPFTHKMDLGIPYVIWDQSEHSCAVECDCGANGPIAYSEAEAIESWNSRLTEGEPT